MWFEKLFGFKEDSWNNVREKLFVDGSKLVSKVDGRSFEYGSLEVPTLAELKVKCSNLNIVKGKVHVREIIGNIQELHCEESNVNALFQAASQFNLLEMVGPEITPESGVDGYERDFTQGPACAIACGAGTVYRNYFAQVNGKEGQTRLNQIDCLELIGNSLNNEELLLWKMRNGYALVCQEGLLNINAQLGKFTEVEREELKDRLKIGLQWNTEVTLSESKHKVSQAYCSALPVAYSHLDSFYWEAFALVILEATYEATLYAGLLNLEKTGCNKVYLTLVGGGAFGNEFEWIFESLEKAIRKFENTALDIVIVSYGSSNSRVRKLINEVMD